MAVGPNLVRRGAVYYWRRRIPKPLVPCVGATHLRLTLNTKDSGEARYLSAQLDANAMEVFASASSSAMSKAQLMQLFKAVYAQQKTKLDLLANAERTRPTTSRAELLAMELARGEAYILLAEQGAEAQVGPQQQERLVAKGYEAIAIERIIEHLEALRDENGIKLSLARLRQHITDTGAAAQASNIVAGLPVYLRAIGEALLRAEERYGERPTQGLPYDELVADAETGLSRQPTAPTAAPPDQKPVGASVLAAVQHPGAGLDKGAVDDSIRVVAETLVAKKTGNTHEWTDKTERQARSIYGLFGRFLVEEYGSDRLGQLRQYHLDAFETFLRSLNGNFGKSPKDKVRSIAELRSRAAEESKTHGTLEAGTLNRHLTFIGQLLRRAKARGVKMDPDLSTTELRSAHPDRGRNQRPVPPHEAMARLFYEPIFIGCASWEEPEASGALIYHRAIYYGSMLAFYEGMRREEYCGLGVDDVVVDNGLHPYLHIAPNEFRGVKNKQSVRNLALHAEVIRLGFLEYRDAVMAAGHKRLFPDLHSLSTRSPLGDRFYDELKASLDRVGFTPHQVRHFFGNSLKQKKVSEEFRADLLGHGGKSETTERYCDPVEIGLQLEQMKHLPLLTAHLERQPIQLLPWVERNEIAP